MKTVSVLASLSRSNGGLFESVRRLHQAMAELPGMEILILGVRDRFTDEDLPSWAPLQVRAFEVYGPQAFQYAPGLCRYLLERDEEILHAHGIWQYPSMAVSAWHRKFRRPYMISAHGMVDAWALRNSAWKKRLAWTFYEGEHFRNARCLRALCASEARAMRAIGLKNDLCVIPNGIDLPPPEAGREHGSPFEAFADGRKILLNLGRLHPKKGLVPLVQAWKAALQSRPSMKKSWALAIAGWDQGGHERELQALCTEAGIDDSVYFLGPKFGAEKAACYRHCEAFILPSFSEGLPVVVLEAWAYEKTAVITPECNLPEGFETGAALRIDSNVETIRRGLEQLVEMSDEERRTMGSRGRALVAERFTWPKIAASMQAVYGWILGGGPTPSCVTSSHQGESARS